MHSAVGTAQASTIWADQPRPKTIIAPRAAPAPPPTPLVSQPSAMAGLGLGPPAIAVGVLLSVAWTGLLAWLAVQLFLAVI
jgi:hypothetical protein